MCVSGGYRCEEALRDSACERSGEQFRLSVLHEGAVLRA